MVDTLQVLRQIDKYDRVGDEGLFDLLTKGKLDKSGAFIDGCNLSNGQALVIVSLISKNSRLQSRLEVMNKLEETILDPRGGDGCGWTAWDELLNMDRNEDETWSNGGRPANIAWALDDILEYARGKTKEASRGVGRATPRNGLEEKG